MSAALGWLSGLIVGLAGVALIERVLDDDTLVRTNFRGRQVRTAAGLAVVVVLVGVEASLAVLERLVEWNEPEPGPRVAVVMAVTGFALLGLVDDLIGDRSTRGLVGHVRALARGRPTTGSLKLVGGALVAVVAVAPLSESVGDLVLAGTLVAGVANLANLFDLRPGRATKVAHLAVLAMLVASGAGDGWFATLVVLGAAAALARRELDETLMLGDTGANALGAAVGVGMVVGLSTRGQLVAVGVVVVVTLASERVSFSRVIDKTPPLRWLDELGRRR